MKKRVLLGASYSSIEPLGLLHLAGLAKEEDWDSKIHLIKDHDFTELFEIIDEYKPDLVGFNVYTGNHLQLADAFKRIKKDYNIPTIVGGPHATYFPTESLDYADYVVMSEGFIAFRQILRGEASLGIQPIGKGARFPIPDREDFYNNYPEHRTSNIKSIISMTGCPYTCSYCYNSSTPKDLMDTLPKEIAERLGKSLGMTGRLFPRNVREIDEVLEEGRIIAENWPTKVIYFQDDVFGFDVKKDGMLEQLAKRWPKEVGIPFHAQMRWEMTVGPAGEKRLDLIRQAGGFGLTLAIEAADPYLRKEVLSRAMPQEMMYQGMHNVITRGFKVRTEQITALPYGATTKETKINLDADIELLNLNVDLKEKTGGPTMAWSSTFAPYKGTKLGTYCATYGHYENKNEDVPDTFFEKSVLRFPKSWVGPQIKEANEWLSDSDLDRYRTQNAELRRIFNFLARVPKGHILAKEYLTKYEEYDYQKLGKETLYHLNNLQAKDKNNKEINDTISGIKNIEKVLKEQYKEIPIKKNLLDLSSYIACLPKAELILDRIVKYNGKSEELDNKVLSNAVRHHLYDNVLYFNDNVV